jgi:hypothetical protein
MSEAIKIATIRTASPKRQNRRSHILKNKAFVQRLISADHRSAIKLLRKLSQPEAATLGECVYNFLYNPSVIQHTGLKKKAFLGMIQRLRRHQDFYRTLANRTVSAEEKQRRIIQQVNRAGGAFPILALIGSLLPSVLGSVISNASTSSVNRP